MKKYIPRAFLHAHFLLAIIFIAGCSLSNRAVDSANSADSDIGVPTITLDPVDVRIPGSDISMRLIPMSGGEMVLGGEASADATMPGVSVRLSPFMIAQTETTFDAFAIFVV